MIHRFGGGCFPDIALNESGGGILIIREGDPKSPGYVVVFRWIGVAPDRLLGLHEAERWAVGGGSPAFCKAYRHDGVWWVAYHDGIKGQLHCLTTNQRAALEPCQNNDPIVFGGGRVAWQGAEHPDHWPITLMDLRDGQTHALGHGQGTGLAYIAPSRVVLNDENRSSVPGIANPVRAHGLIVGEDPDPNNRDNLSLLWSLGGDHGRLWHAEPCLTPRCAVAGPWLGVTTWGQGSDVRLFVGTLEQLIAASAAPVPEPQPIPEPGPMSQLPDYSDFVDGFLAPRLTRFDGDEPRTRAHSFEALNACAAALRQQDKRVGLLIKTGGSQVRDRAADIIAIDLGNNTCQLIDAISDAEGHDGAPSPDWREIPEHEDGIRPISQWSEPFPVGGAQPAPVPPAQHVYDGGENDTGECDRCGQPRSGPLHIAAPPIEESPTGGVTNAQIMAAIQKLSARFDAVFR